MAGESKGSKEAVVETVQRTCPFLLANHGWKCELGATKGLGLHRTNEFQQDRASENRTYTALVQRLFTLISPYALLYRSLVVSHFYCWSVVLFGSADVNYEVRYVIWKAVGEFPGNKLYNLAVIAAKI